MVRFKVIRSDDHARDLSHHQERGTPERKATVKCEDEGSGRRKKNALK